MDPLEGSLTKLYRTTEHFDTISKMVKRATSDKGHTFSVKLDHQTQEAIIFIRPKSIRYRKHHLPLMISVLIGEFLHNLRSALDNMVYDLVIHDGGMPDEYTEFPIFRHRRKYNSTARGGGLFKLHGVSPKGRAFIKGLQPFDDRNPPNPVEPLWILHELSRIDKHRLVHVCGMKLKMGQVFVTDDRGFLTRTTIHTDTRIEGRTELVRFAVRANSGYDEMEVKFEHALDVVFYDVALVEGDSVLTTLYAMQAEVLRILNTAHTTLFS